MKIPEKRKREIIDSTLKVIDSTSEYIAETRRMVELYGVMPLEEFDKKLNESCAKWHEKYSKMSGEKIMMKHLMELVMNQE